MASFQHKLHEWEFIYRDCVFSDYTNIERLKRCEQFEFRKSDVVICTFPRTGTTVTQEIIWEVLNHDIIEKDAKYEALRDRFCFMEYVREDDVTPSTYTLDKLEKTEPTTRRLIKTHLPYFLLQQQLEKVKPKIIIVLRNPKDTAVAFDQFMRYPRPDLEDSWSDFLEIFINGKTIYGDYFKNCLEWWSLRDQENVLILRYEDIVNNRQPQVQAIADFLDQTLTQEQLDIIVHNTAFGTMKKNEKVNSSIGPEKKPFLRQGRSGTWKDTFTVTQSEIMDRVIEERLQGSGLTFTFS